MPTLHWIGKDKVINHHQDVPFRLLDHQYGALADGTQTTEPTGSGNRIIHGDNLEALKALLPEYEGRVKCIYIDPPYNTGNEGWVYNDNVNDPKIKKWLSQVVGKEGEDLSRHDKWLCMMYPRLKLLHKLLAEDGVLLISIDDNELYNAKLLCDEIFGQSNFITSFIWRRRSSSQLSGNNVSVDHEYVVTYSKTPNRIFNGVLKDYGNYKNPDNDPNGPWTLGDLTVGMTKEQRPNQYYDLIDESTGIAYPASAKRVWTYIRESMEERLKAGKIVFPKNGTGRPMLKRYLKDLRSDINPVSSLLVGDDSKVGLNTEGTRHIQSIFESKVFDYPKPVSLLTVLLSQVTQPDTNDIILDSFAGSGTTAHAVLKLNQQDGGNRRFILTEMEDYAERITAERVKRVMQGYAGQPGTGGSFDYYTLGTPIFTEAGELNEQAGLEGLRQYLYYAETKQHLPAPSADDNAAFLGLHNDTAYYFHYQLDAVTTLGHEFLATMRTRAGQYIIYADNCLLPAEFMTQHGIIFKKIPRDISRF